VGADGRASTNPNGNDDSMVQFQNASWLSERGTPWGLPKVPPTDAWAIYEAFVAHPNHFVSWENTRANQNTQYRNEVTRSKHSEEVVSAAYVRGDLSLLDRRLKLIGGVRAEQTNIKGEGPLTDPTRNIQRNANGTPILGPNGQPLPITTDALDTSRLTYIDRGATTEKEYLRWFPSLNASYGIRENLIARAGYYHSVGRPSLNQYGQSRCRTWNAERLEQPDQRPTPASRPGAHAPYRPGYYYFEGVGQIYRRLSA
jgi:hypothetical protein